MEDAMRRLKQAQEEVRNVLCEEAQRCIRSLLGDAVSRERLLRFMAGLGIDPSQILDTGAQAGGDPYRVLGLDRSAPDELVRRRYRELLVRLHPDTAGVRGTEYLFQVVTDAYRQIAKERGWQP